MVNKQFTNALLANLISIFLVVVSLPLMLISLLTWALFIGSLGLALMIVMELKDGHN